MNNREVYQAVCVLLLLFVSACSATSNSATSNAEVKAQALRCEEPRPKMCTREYRPVCATRDNGVRCVTTPCNSTELRTYPNACNACADNAVYAYSPNACR
jgi:hypothetical protein